jgi:hypothetical protein
MKSLLAICTIVVATFVWAQNSLASAPGAGGGVRGTVLETQDAGGYTYLRLKTKDGETWAAVNQAKVNKGAEVTVENVMVMNNFESKSLKKTFPTILFGNLGSGAGSAPAGSAAYAGPGMAKAHANLGKPMEMGDIHVPKAHGANAHTVAEITTKGAKLKDKPVLVRGKVVKYNPGIMGKNWVHLMDGTGNAAAKTNDILVTTMGQAKVGDIVTVKGIVRTDKDFGAGYAYKVLIEEATLQK